MKLSISILIPLVIGLTAGLFTRNGLQNWYVHLQKPWFNPPNWLFGPVWTLLYILMGIALYLVWKQSPLEVPGRNNALAIFAIQLLLNFCWSFFFFNLHSPALAMVDIVLLWMTILLTILSFGKISSTAAWLLVPYISWVSFAAILNGYILALNKGS